jgi:hypothetical protein
MEAIEFLCCHFDFKIDDYRYREVETQKMRTGLQDKHSSKYKRCNFRHNKIREKYIG